MPAYVIAQIGMHDRNGDQEHIDGFSEIFNRQGGEGLAGTRHMTWVLEELWVSNRVLLSVRLPEAARAWHFDAHYQKLVKH
ncbi:MAG: DUF1330 domain-containing protein [Pseudomonadota bacterium]